MNKQLPCHCITVTTCSVFASKSPTALHIRLLQEMSREVHHLATPVLGHQQGVGQRVVLTPNRSVAAKENCNT